MNLMNNENTIAKLVAQNFGYAKPNLSDIKKSIRHAQYKLAAAVRVCDGYYERTGERRNSYSKRGWELSDKVMDARKCLVAALGLEHNDTIVRRLVDDAIVGEFYDFVRAQKEYREEFRNSPLNDATKQAEVAMANAHQNYQAALVVAMMQKGKTEAADTDATPGPWVAHHVSGIVSYAGTPVLLASECKLNGIGGSKIGNLNLAAAAPELLEALTECLHELGRLSSTLPNDPTCMDKARAAIRKAKGE